MFGFILTNGLSEACPVQLEMHSYAFICICADHSEQLYNHQSECAIFTNQTVLFVFLICIEMGQSGTWVGTFSIKAHFLEAALSRLQTVLLCKISPFTVPQIGDCCWYWIERREFLLTVT